jgi:hypothetical protein
LPECVFTLEEHAFLARAFFVQRLSGSAVRLMREPSNDDCAAFGSFDLCAAPPRQGVTSMFKRLRSKGVCSMLRRLIVSTATMAAMAFFSVPVLYAQSGMCAAGGTGTTTTGTTGSVSTTGTTTGSTLGRGTGTAGTTTQALGLLQAVQTAQQFQMMAAQQEQAQALAVMQALYAEEEMMRLNQLQIEQYRAHRLALAQKRRTVQAAKAQQRKNRLQNSGTETLVLEKPGKAAKRT